jgi:hypothetical protein
MDRKLMNPGARKHLSGSKLKDTFHLYWDGWSFIRWESCALGLRSALRWLALLLFITLAIHVCLLITRCPTLRRRI